MAPLVGVVATLMTALVAVVVFVVVVVEQASSGPVGHEVLVVGGC